MMRLRASNAIAVCAGVALAMVFSVQQGEHGPLVVYKLEVPAKTAPAARPLPPPAPVAAPTAEPVTEPLYVIPSRAPRVLGTVVMPAEREALVPAAPLPAPLPPREALQPAPSPVPDGIVTLQDVSDEVQWRRETAESLPAVPFAPSF